MSEILVVFGSAVSWTWIPPRDIDVAFTGEWTPADEATVRIWAVERGLAPDLPIDSHRVTGTTEISLPRVRSDETPSVAILRGDVSIRWITHSALPARIRAVRNATEMAAVLTAPNFCEGRLALVDRPNDLYGENEWTGYTQGLTALRSAIAKCAFWSSSIDACAKIERLLDRGLAPSEKRKLRGGASGGSPDVNCIVTDGGMLPIHGRFVVRFPHQWARKRSLVCSR